MESVIANLEAWAQQVTDAVDGRPLPEYPDATPARIQIMRTALEKSCFDTDYCYVCNCHPSHGHAKGCILKKEAN